MFILCSFSLDRQHEELHDQLESSHPQAIYSYSNNVIVFSGTKDANVQSIKADIYRFQPTEASIFGYFFIFYLFLSIYYIDICIHQLFIPRIGL